MIVVSVVVGVTVALTLVERTLVVQHMCYSNQTGYNFHYNFYFEEIMVVL